MTVLVVLLVLVVIVWRLRRRSRAVTLAGLDSTRPTFHLEPPLRRLTERKREAL